MKKLTSVFALGLVLASGSAVAANTYGVQSDQEFVFAGGIKFQSATQYVDNEVVELSSSAFSDVSASYDADLYLGSK